MRAEVDRGGEGLGKGRRFWLPYHRAEFTTVVTGRTGQSQSVLVQSSY